MKVIVVEYLTQKGHAYLFANICQLLINGGCDFCKILPNDFSKEDLKFCEY